MAIRFMPKDQAASAPVAPAKLAGLKTDAPKAAGETPAAGTDLFSPELNAPARKRTKK